MFYRHILAYFPKPKPKPKPESITFQRLSPSTQAHGPTAQQTQASHEQLLGDTSKIPATKTSVKTVKNTSTAFLDNAQIQTYQQRSEQNRQK